MIFDPWMHAQKLAERISKPGAALIVVIGAQSWCQKCRDIYPQFEQAAKTSAAHESYIWLDLEEHAQFLGGFIPDDLPLSLRYQNARLVQAQLLRLDDAPMPVEVGDPGVYARLCEDNWGH